MQDLDAQILAPLRDTDRDRYLACLLAPREKRHSLACLYAFYAEIARIRDVIREPLPGEIRLQWWRDLLESRSGARATRWRRRSSVALTSIGCPSPFCRT